MNEINKSDLAFIGRLVETHKIHEKDADILFGVNLLLKFLVILATVGVFIVLIFKDAALPLTKEAIALFDLFIIMFDFAYRPDEIAKNHKKTAKKLLSNRDKLDLLMSDFKNEDLSKQQYIKQRNLIVDSTNKIYRDSPRTTFLGCFCAKHNLF